MYVCNCAAVTQRELYRRLHQGAIDFKTLRAELGVCKGCGKCAREVRELLKSRGDTEQSRTDSWPT